MNCLPVSAFSLSTVDSTPRPSGFPSRRSPVLPTSTPLWEKRGKRRLSGHTYIFYPADSLKSESLRRPLPPWSGLTVVAAPVHSALVYHIRLWMLAEWRKASPTTASRRVPYTLVPKNVWRNTKLPQKSSRSLWLAQQCGGGRSFKGDLRSLVCCRSLCNNSAHFSYLLELA